MREEKRRRSTTIIIRNRKGHIYYSTTSLLLAATSSPTTLLLRNNSSLDKIWVVVFGVSKTYYRYPSISLQCVRWGKRLLVSRSYGSNFFRRNHLLPPCYITVTPVLKLVLRFSNCQCSNPTARKVLDLGGGRETRGFEGSIHPPVLIRYTISGRKHSIFIILRSTTKVCLFSAYINDSGRFRFSRGYYSPEL